MKVSSLILLALLLISGVNGPNVSCVNAQTYETANSLTIYLSGVSGTIEMDTELSSSEDDVDTYLTYDQASETTSSGYETSMAIFNAQLSLDQCSLFGKDDDLIGHRAIWNSTTWDNTADTTNWDTEAMGAVQEDSYGYYLSFAWDVNEDGATATTAEYSRFTADDDTDATVDGYSFDSDDFIYIVAKPNWDTAQNASLTGNRIDIKISFGYGASTIEATFAFEYEAGTSTSDFAAATSTIIKYAADEKYYVLCYNLLEVLNARTGGSYTSGVVDKVMAQRYVYNNGEQLQKAFNTTNDGATLEIRQLCVLESEDADGFHLLEDNSDSENAETYDLLTNDTDGTIALSLDDTTKDRTEFKELNGEWHYLTLDAGIAEWSANTHAVTDYSFNSNDADSASGSSVVRTDTFDLKDSTEEPLSYSGTYYVNITNLDESDYAVQQITFEVQEDDPEELFEADGDVESGFSIDDEDGTSITDLDSFFSHEEEIPYRISVKTAITAENNYQVKVEYDVKTSEVPAASGGAAVLAYIGSKASAFWGWITGNPMIVGAILVVAVVGLLAIILYAKGGKNRFKKKR